MEVITEYFDNLSEEQVNQFATLIEATVEWNTKVNLISRKDIENFELKHVLHSLVINQFTPFAEGSRILDLGTGGGLPGLPLAIMNPHAKFVLIDARGKKITAVRDMIKRMQLKNVEAHHIRAEDYQGNFDFIVSRAVAPMEKLFNWSRHLYRKKEINAIPNGLIALKGGNIEDELKPLEKKTYTEVVPVNAYFDEPEFEEKFVVYAQSA